MIYVSEKGDTDEAKEQRNNNSNEIWWPTNSFQLINLELFSLMPEQL